MLETFVSQVSDIDHAPHYQVDETMLTEDTQDESLLPPPPSYPGTSGNNPFVQMSLPGGGMVTLPMDTLPPGSPDTLSSSTGTIVTGPGQVSAPGAGSLSGNDVLSVTAGEPSTHFNLDQLLNIVQSFQLDTTHAHTGDNKGDNKVCVLQGNVLAILIMPII